MGMRLKYHNLKIRKMNFSPATGKRMINKWAVVEGTKLVSTVRGLSKTEAVRQLKEFKKVRMFKFTG